MALGCQVNDAVHVILLEQMAHGFEVADVGLDKGVVGLVLNVLEVGQVAGVGELVEINDLVVRVFVDKKSDYMAADKSGPAGDNDMTFKFHFLIKT